MNLFGIALRKPSFNEVTAAAVMATGLWMVFAGAMRIAGHPLGTVDAGAALIVSLWACVGARLGIRIDHGTRHLLASVAGSALLLGLYEGARQLLA